MKVALILFWNSIFSVVSAQDYIEYNAQISLAETAFLSDSFESSIILYSKTFKEFNKCFPNDAYIAAEVSSYIGKLEFTDSFLRKGMLWGLNLKVLDEPIFKEFCKSPFYPNLFNDFDSLHEIYNKRINFTYRDKIYTLRNDDLRSNQTHSLFNRIFRSKRSYQKLVENSCSLLTEMTYMIEEYGLPSIENIGVSDRKTSDLSDTSIYKNGTNGNLGWFILWHCHTSFQEWEAHLNDALKNGDISSFYFAVCMDFGARFMESKLPNSEKEKIHNKTPYYFVRWIDPFEPLTDENEINTLRQKIGLMTLASERKKKLWQNKHNQLLMKNLLDIDRSKYIINLNYYIL